MLLISDYASQPMEFWADVRTISQGVGYTVRGENRVRVPTAVEVADYYERLNLDSGHLVSGRLWTSTGRLLFDYFRYRAEVLEQSVKPLLMDAEQARMLYVEQRDKLNPRLEPPMNKQRGEKRQVAYLTALVNMSVEAATQGYSCDYDPRSLTLVTQGYRPLRTLARRVDGAFPSVVDPIALWEIKEYYHTTTFGSRIADGVYETLLDGMELKELREASGIHVRHYLMVDAYKTWWEDGRSYLCRMIDMAYMGYVDEVLFGREVIDRIPELANEWIAELELRLQSRGSITHDRLL